MTGAKLSAPKIICVYVLCVFIIASVFAYGPQEPPLNAGEWDRAGKLLKRAAEMVKEHGWQQGSKNVVFKDCMATALERAFFERRAAKYSIVDFNYASEALSRAIGVPREQNKRQGDPLDVPYWGRSFMEWNDKANRKQPEVISAFTKAISIAEQMKAKAVKANKRG